MSPLLEIRDLYVDLMTDRGIIHALNGVELVVGKGEIHGLVGESGCGKSVTSRTVMRLLNKHTSQVRGSIIFDGEDLLTFSEKEMAKLRGNDISLIFQNPMTSLSPLETIGKQIEGAIENHQKIQATKRRRLVLELLEQVGLNPASRLAKQYPFELSGGMQQRVMIAQAISCSPKLLIADEPTTSLDVTIQAQILSLLKELQHKTGMSILIITHNFSVVSKLCDSVSVMYAGSVVEKASARELISAPLHPYSKALIDCIPYSGKSKRGTRLPMLSGNPPLLYERPSGCSFLPRCAYANETCKMRPLLRGNAIHSVLCHRALLETKDGEGI
jgi:oligopeptide/dipeptide ABC transporter ATP-binding protein